MNATDYLLHAGETTLAVSILIALVLLVRKPFAQLFGARAAYCLWLAPVARLFLPEIKILNPEPASEIATVMHVVNFTPAVSAPAAFDIIAFGSATALFLWITVAVAWFAIRLEQQWRTHKLMMKDSDEAPPELIDEAAEVQQRLGIKKKLSIRISRQTNGPLISGLLRPVVILPNGFMTDFSLQERRLALAHELTHLRRGDLAANFAAIFLQSVQWPNPLAHFAYRAFRTDQEAACDAYVLSRFEAPGAAGDYASTIMKAVRNQPTPSFELTMGHPLKERIMLLKKPNTSRARRMIGRTSASILVAISVAATASYGYAEGESEEKDKEIVEVESNVVQEKRVLVFNGAEDEIIFDDMVAGDRVRVLEFDDGDGERRFIRIKDGEKVVRVYDKDGKLVTEDITPVTDEDMSVWVYGDDAERVVVRGFDGAKSPMGQANCVASEGQGEPIMLEFKDESGDKNNKSVHHTVICLTGEEAKPENRAQALRKAIDQLEAKAKEDEAQRKKMIKSLRQQARELEKKD